LVVVESVEAVVGPTHWVPGRLSIGVKRSTCVSILYIFTVLSLY
jgi:hypothetical protein